MAYQQVGTPRFYVNVLEWLIHNNLIETYAQVGSVITNTNEWLYTLPITPKQWIHAQIGNGIIVDSLPTGALTENSFIAVLGHDLASNTQWYRLWDSVDDSNQNMFDSNNYGWSDLVNGSNGSAPEFDGFSITGWDGSSLTNLYCEFFGHYAQEGQDYPKLGSIIIGSYYDMPHSPDLNLSLSYDYSGVKEITTRGGASLSNSFYSKPPMWGALGSWELEEGGDYVNLPNLSRSGRRIWDLSFSYLDDGDVFGSNPTLGKYDLATAWGLGESEINQYDSDDVADGGNHKYNILDDDNFYSQVIHKTNGGQLPFIFQPNKDDNTNFAIAKIDSGFTVKQVANSVYNIKMKIREVW